MLAVLRDHCTYLLGIGTAVPAGDTSHPAPITQPLQRRILAPFGQLAWLPKPADECPTRTYPPRGVKQHDRVGSFKAKVERFAVVAVGNPGVVREQATLLLPPFAF
ncbi:MAG TPA: hypothetical protein VKQ30_24910 [Ktedonobacterales bacterium]|nr:hypothetical protein [Ktedonobacterales bacterium]